MKKALVSLLKVKSLITVLLTGVFCYLAVVGKIDDKFLNVYLMVIAFYFGKQVGENGNENGNKIEEKTNKKG